MKKILSAIFVLAMLLALLGCGKKMCSHDYYASNYVPATTTSNGYTEYTCKLCGESYKEVIPQKEPTNSEGEHVNSPEDVGGYSKDSKTVNLFDLPIYSKSDDFIDTVIFMDDAVDTKGYHHYNCYEVATSESGLRYVRYDLGGKYRTITGTLFEFQSDSGRGGTGWLEFFDGEEFLFATDKVTDETSSVTFSFDISDVKYLTIYPKCNNQYACTWLGSDEIKISK